MPRLHRVAGERPAEGAPLVSIPARHERGHRGAQRGRAARAAVVEYAARQEAEPALDLVHPGRMQRREVEVEALAGGVVEVRPARAAMDDEIVPDDGDTARGVGGGDLLHEGEQIGRGAPRAAAPEHVAGMDIRPSPPGRRRRTGPATSAPCWV